MIYEFEAVLPVHQRHAFEAALPVHKKI